MSIQEDYLTGIANAIREKTGETGIIQASKFAEKISGIQSTSTLEERTITPSTTQQIITPNTGYDGMSKVTVEAMPSGELSTPTISSGGLITAQVETSGYLDAGRKKTLQLTTQDGTTFSPGKDNALIVPKGVYTTGNVFMQGDTNLVPENIRVGTSIFGVFGTIKNIKVKHLTGTTDSNSVLSFNVGESISRITSIWGAIPISSWSIATNTHVVFAMYFDETVNWTNPTHTKGYLFAMDYNSASVGSILYNTSPYLESTLDSSGNVTFYDIISSQNFTPNASWDIFVAYE